MKLNPNAVAAAKELRPYEDGSQSRYDFSVLQLEEIDFDNAIAILQELNKKTKVKEWKLAKEAFKAKDYKESVRDFLDTLRSDACGRADHYTRKSIDIQINKNFNLRTNFSRLWMDVLSKPFECLANAEQDVENSAVWLEKCQARAAIVEDFISNNDIEKLTEEYLEAIKEQINPKGEHHHRYY